MSTYYYYYYIITIASQLGQLSLASLRGRLTAYQLRSFFFFFIVQTLSFIHCTCNFICGLSDVIIKTFSSVRLG